jgi:hypothetical protein
MKRILLITTVYRTGEKIYPVLKPLSEHYHVDVMNLFQMSQSTSWNGPIDLRKSFYEDCTRLGCRVFNGPAFEREENAENYADILTQIDHFLSLHSPDLVLIDNNTTIRGGQNSEIYSWFHKRGIPVLASPHGNKDYKGYRVLKHINRYYDYSFVFGKKEVEGLARAEKKRAKLKGNLLPAGIPANDRLKEYERGKDYVLVIPNYTDPKFIVRQVAGFKPLTKKLFDKLKIRDLGDRYGRKILIKEKNKQSEKSTLLKDSLASYDSVEFVMDCPDDNELIAKAACVISAPSTMAFKPIQMGVPTAILQGHGLLGNFFDFPGLVNSSAKEIKNTIREQEKSGRCKKFIRDTLEGGWDFSATQKYCEHIDRVADG